uniref:Uncharacterized protein n=1 Tax=Anas zonorhyncha TaxID=75864 RepID=A0A8B9VQ45_9AVES
MSSCRVASSISFAPCITIKSCSGEEVLWATSRPPSLGSSPSCSATWLASFLLLLTYSRLSRFFSASWKMVGTAVGFSSRCWSSSRLEKLSLVKCSLQRNEYLVGVQLSL